jgi:hypothetical protein
MQAKMQLNALCLGATRSDRELIAFTLGWHKHVLATAWFSSFWWQISISSILLGLFALRKNSNMGILLRKLTNDISPILEPTNSIAVCVRFIAAGCSQFSFLLICEFYLTWGRIPSFSSWRVDRGRNTTFFQGWVRGHHIRGQGQTSSRSRPRPDRFEARPRPKLMWLGQYQ